jgi:hypothetical protein
VRAIGALVIILLGILPALFAGIPGLEPEVFESRLGGVPLGVVVMCLLMLAFIGASAWCSAAARDSERKSGGV